MFTDRPAVGRVVIFIDSESIESEKKKHTYMLGRERVKRGGGDQ